MAEVDTPPTADFVKDYQPGQMQRLLALECVQDPGNLVGRNLLLSPSSCIGIIALSCVPQKLDQQHNGSRLPVVQGSLLRTAAGLGWDGVFLLPGVGSAAQDCTRAMWTWLLRAFFISTKVLYQCWRACFRLLRPFQ